MQSKFWRRWGKKNLGSETRAAQPQDAPSFRSLLSQSSAKEILGLQQLIGNQAVLRILTPDKKDTTA